MMGGVPEEGARPTSTEILSTLYKGLHNHLVYFSATCSSGWMVLSGVSG